jgi:Ser-tRNA(Ala) deacylase AlaX
LQNLLVSGFFIFTITDRLLLLKPYSMETPELNAHNKQEYPPMHTAEHILNQTMVRLFGCPRSRNAHIERKKSKCDYLLSEAPTEEQVAQITNTINEVISSNLPVTIDFVSKEEAASFLDLGKLPGDASDTIRVIRVGDYDTCACIGTHVENTSEIGKFTIISHDFSEGRWRVRFKLEN